ncbi:DMT family transporter [uncultured Shewanella sp.]|uniref:DMT family transporter n=1 Tax=uncultured Shewanella sp. TaxID=173975 RepID=UPI0026301822|nr:DMT family transporter [uncultured Shewanella sp.]
MPNSIVYPSIMLLAGIGIPVMAALNSNLGVKLGSSALATTIVFFVGLLVSLAYLTQAEGDFSSLFSHNIAWYLYLGGALVAFYIFSITWVSPKFGIGNAVSFVLLGQLIAISIIDHFGLLGARQTLLDSGRILGLVLMVVGVFLVIKRT